MVRVCGHAAAAAASLNVAAATAQVLDVAPVEKLGDTVVIVVCI